MEAASGQVSLIEHYVRLQVIENLHLQRLKPGKGLFFRDKEVWRWAVWGWYAGCRRPAVALTVSFSFCSTILSLWLHPVVGCFVIAGCCHTRSTAQVFRDSVCVPGKGKRHWPAGLLSFKKYSRKPHLSTSPVYLWPGVCHLPTLAAGESGKGSFLTEHMVAPNEMRLPLMKKEGKWIWVAGA